MERSEGAAGIDPNPNSDPDLPQQFSGKTRFDASQYAFFGEKVLEDVELAGLEDDDATATASLVGLDDEEFCFSSLGNKEEDEGRVSLSDIDDLSTTFSKLNRVVSGPKSLGSIGDRRSFSMETPSAIDWSHDAEFSMWLDQDILDADNVLEGKRWWSQPQPPIRLSESKPLYRASSYPQQQPHQHVPNDPVVVPKSPFTSYPPPGGRTVACPGYSHHPSNGALAAGSSQVPFCAQGLSSFSTPQLHLQGLSHDLHYAGNMPQLTSPNISINSQPQNYWFNQASLYSGDPSKLLPNSFHQQLPRANGLIPSQLLVQQQQHRLHQLQKNLVHLSALQSHLYNRHSSHSHLINMGEAMFDMRDSRSKQHKGRSCNRYTQSGSDTSSQKSNNGLPQFRSKYMSSEEIESILKIQHAATHSNDPYVDDYYHQACLAKKLAGSRVKHHFCPSHHKDPPRSRGSNDTHAHLQLDALGRLPLSSIRRPKPLLEVDPPLAFGDGNSEQKNSERPLEQEPMLAARVTIEDSFFLLLEVDDIDRLLQFGQTQDGGSQLRRKRQALLEGLATSLQLVDPLGTNNSGHSIGLSPNDDFVFLRLISLLKGRKLFIRYLQLIFPGSDLMRIVCMAIFRHLRFLFGVLPSDASAAESTVALSQTVSACVGGMDLSALSACLAAIVCSHEQPPLRPIGSPAGDGATIIIRSVLKRATELLIDPHATSTYSITNRTLWQASFNAFFVLLTKYCVGKYETIMQSLLMQVPNAALIGAEAVRAINREMPVELLHASLPHTDEHQRKLLLDFTQRSMPASGFSSHGGGHVNSESVPS